MVPIGSGSLTPHRLLEQHDGLVMIAEKSTAWACLSKADYSSLTQLTRRGIDTKTLFSAGRNGFGEALQLQ